MLDIEDRVKNGVDWLNGVMPFWYRRINLSTLNMNEQTLCIIGQLFGSYNYIYNQGFDTQEIMSMGFTFTERYNNHAEEKELLEKEWKKIISEMKKT